MRWMDGMITIMMGTFALACAVEDGGSDDQERAALVDAAQEDVSLALVEHAVCMEEPEAGCSETEEALVTAMEELRDLRDDEQGFRASISVSCGSRTFTCSGSSCWGQDDIGCICTPAGEAQGEITLCIQAEQ